MTKIRIPFCTASTAETLIAASLLLALASCATHPSAPVATVPGKTVAALAPLPDGPLQRDAETRPALDAFIQDMANHHGFNAVALHNLFASVQPLPPVGPQGAGPADWAAYRALFVTPKIIAAGTRFMRDNHAALANAEATYHVPAEVVAAIIGVETHYGENMGRNRVLDTLSWKAFRPNRRQRFYRNELTNYLLLCRENGWDARTVLGSSAGAIGLGQFEPSSYRRIAVDFDGDGKRDLYSDPADAIGSIAHYFALSHWRDGQPAALEAEAQNDDVLKLLQKEPDPAYALSKLEADGIKPDAAAPDNLHTGLIALNDGRENEYWLTYRNFNVIKTYNRDDWYAMAVWQLSQALKKNLLEAPPAGKVAQGGSTKQPLPYRPASVRHGKQV